MKFQTEKGKIFFCLTVAASIASFVVGMNYSPAGDHQAYRQMWTTYAMGALFFFYPIAMAFAFGEHDSAPENKSVLWYFVPLIAHVVGVVLVSVLDG